jgi:hypothetical protein
MSAREREREVEGAGQTERDQRRNPKKKIVFILNFIFLLKIIIIIIIDFLLFVQRNSDIGVPSMWQVRAVRAFLLLLCHLLKNKKINKYKKLNKIWGGSDVFYIHIHKEKWFPYLTRLRCQ